MFALVTLVPQIGLPEKIQDVQLKLFQINNRFLFSISIHQLLHGHKHFYLLNLAPVSLSPMGMSEKTHDECLHIIECITEEEH